MTGILARSVTPAARLRGRLTVPADKSIAHRALIVNALSGGPAVVEARSPGLDVLSTAACLRSLGVTVEEERDGPDVRFAISGEPEHDADLDCGNSGTTMRLLAGAVAGMPLHVVLDGDASFAALPNLVDGVQVIHEKRARVPVPVERLRDWRDSRGQGSDRCC